MIQVKNGAGVEPDALKKMREDINILQANMDKTSKALYSKTEELNTSFQDGNFNNLFTVITSFKENTNKLNVIFKEFTIYLEKQEKIIRSYVDKTGLKNNINNI
jgi:hypothetical protein